MQTDDKRAVSDFEIEFSNGGGLQGQGFRLDIEGDDVVDDALARFIISDLRLLMVGSIRILNKRIIQELHKRAAASSPGSAGSGAKFIDVSHVIESGMVTYKGLPAPLICDFLSRGQSRSQYEAGTEFQIGRIDMVANTGTYLDAPYHRYAEGRDLARLPLDRISDIPGVVLRVTGLAQRSIDWTNFAAVDVRGRAVLIHSGWDTHWRTDQYFEGHPFLTRKAAEYLRDQGAVLVGIDSLNIDDISGKSRPVHSVLLAADIPIVEHLTNLAALPTEGFRFSAVPPKVSRMGSFPIRAYARI
ncbi:MAG TPA: cyclase family protein [Bryobacteraceae bacterium]|jgi:kynurenine formamidase